MVGGSKSKLEEKKFKAQQLNFDWAPQSDTKLELSRQVVQPRFSERFLDLILKSKAVTEQTRFIQNLIDRDPDLIFIKDREQRFVMVNSAVAEVYGTTTRELISKRDCDVNPNHREVEHFLNDDLEVLRTGKEKIIPAESLTAADGTKRTVRTIKTPILNSEGVATHVLGIASDISTQYELILFRKLLASSTDPMSKLLSMCTATDFQKQVEPEKPAVLVVDDDDAVQEITKEILDSAGFKVFVASDGYAGFERYIEHADSIRLIILDIAMPRVDGEELFRQLRKVAPNIPIVVCSGLQENTVLRNITPDEFLAKPYDPRKLLKVVNRLLEQ